jgi:hypothetical protein
MADTANGETQQDQQMTSAPLDVEAWIRCMSSDATPPVERVAMASEIADVMVRYIDALNADDADGARAELAVLRELCEERIAALKALPRRSGPRPN